MLTYLVIYIYGPHRMNTLGVWRYFIDTETHIDCLALERDRQSAHIPLVDRCCASNLRLGLGPCCKLSLGAKALCLYDRQETMASICRNEISGRDINSKSGNLWDNFARITPTQKYTHSETNVFSWMRECSLGDFRVVLREMDALEEHDRVHLSEK